MRRKYSLQLVAGILVAHLCAPGNALAIRPFVTDDARVVGKGHLQVELRETIPNRPPGIALALGGLPPTGKGEFVTPGWSAFSYLAMTQDATVGGGLWGDTVLPFWASSGVRIVSADLF